MLTQNERASVGRIYEVFHDESVYEGIVVALAKVAADAALTEKDRFYLEEAKRFLLRVQEGYKWPENVRLDLETRSCAASLCAAVKSLPVRGVHVDFLLDVNGMLSSVEKILAQGSLDDKQKTNELREFFSSLFRNSVTQFDEMLSRPRIPRSFEWKGSDY